MLEETYGHSPLRKMFDQADVYGVSYDEERAARRKVRLGIIGAGAVAVSKHWPAIKRLRTIWEPVEVVAFARRDERAGKAIAEVWGGCWYRDYAEMLDRETLDGVLILGPNATHAEHATACIEKGLPVLVEKPFSLSLVEGCGGVRLATAWEMPGVYGLEAGSPLPAGLSRQKAKQPWQGCTTGMAAVRRANKRRGRT